MTDPIEVLDTLRPELQLLLRCCRQRFDLCHIDAVRGLVNVPTPPQPSPPAGREPVLPLLPDWSLIYRLALHHGVAPLVFHNLQQVGLSQLGIPDETVAAFRQATYQNIAVKAGIAVTLGKILRFCDKRNIRVMIIKGAALDLLVYRQPWYTIHDVDLVFDQPQSALSPATFTELDEYFWDLPGFEYDFYAHHDVTMNDMLAIDFAEILGDAQTIEVNGQQAWVMSPEDMVLAAAINCARKRFFRLKSLLALSVLLDHVPQLDWAILINKAQRYRCTTILYMALSATQTTIGCRLPADLGPDLASDLAKKLGLSTLRARFLRWLIKRNGEQALLRGKHRFLPMARTIDRSLLLPYATYGPARLWQRAHNLRQSRQLL